MMKLSARILAWVVILSIVLPNLYVIYTGRESFPFTQAPMFGHYIGPQTHFYDFNFIGNDGQSQQVLYPSPTYTNKEPPMYFRTLRLFFKLYGSAEENSCFGFYKNDSKEKFEQRMSLFFIAYFKYINEGFPDIKTIQLKINQYDRSYNLKDSHIVGYYDMASKNFVSTWKSRP